MCQFQKEINSKIQEKKALELPTDSRFPTKCPSKATEGRDKHLELSWEGLSEGTHKLEEDPDRAVADTQNLTEGSSEPRCHCQEEESVGLVYLHAF